MGRTRISPLVGNKGLECLLAKTRELAETHGVRTQSGAVASPSTVKSTSEVLVACMGRIWNLGFHLDDPAKLRRHHIDALVVSWVQAGYSHTTMANSLSRLRQLALWLGSPDLVSDHAQKSPRKSRPTLAASASSGASHLVSP